MWRIKQCPRCRGDVYIHQDIHGWYEECLQCSYTRDLSTSDLFVERKGIHVKSGPTRSAMTVLDEPVKTECSQRTADKTAMQCQNDGESTNDESYLEDILKEFSDYKQPKKFQRRKHRVLAWSLADILNPTAEKLKPRVQDFRTILLGLSKPVPLNKLKEILLELGASERSDGAPLPYPKGEYLLEDIRGVHNVPTGGLLDLDYVYIPMNRTHRLSLLYHFILTLSHILDCHPSIALAFVICDIMPKAYTGPTIIKSGNKLNIQVHSPDTAPQQVSEIYTIGRNIILEKRRQVQGRWTRPRRYSDKVLKLLRFKMDNPKVRWKDLIIQWNNQCEKDNPHWKFSNLHSMQVTYYRALRKTGKIT